MSTREAAGFLEHIRAHPGDDAPRLVYADWLDEHGDPDRAEFIRLQCERAGLPDWDARHVALLFRERTLLRRHLGRWRDELPRLKGVTWGAFRRGFVAAVEFASFAAFKARAAAVWRWAPVEEATIRWPRREDDAAALAPIPHLRELSVTGTVVDMEDVARLAAAPVLSTLRALNVRSASLGVEGFRRLAWSSHLSGLQALRVPFNSIGNGAVGVLSHTAILPALAEIDLSETGSYGRYGEDPIIDPTGMEELAAWPGLARVHTLSLSGNDVRRDGLRALLRSPHLTALKRLALRGSGLDAPAAQEFAVARPGLTLDELDLGENLLGDSAGRHLVKAAWLGGLKVLALDQCELEPAGTRKLAKAPLLAELRVLDASYNYFGHEGLAALLAARPPHLHTLRLQGNEVRDTGASYLAQSPASDTLLRLDLGQNRLCDPAAVELARSPHLKNLLALRLTDNPMSPAAVASLRKSELGRRLAALEAPGEQPPPGGDEIPF